MRQGRRFLNVEQPECRRVQPNHGQTDEGEATHAAHPLRFFCPKLKTQ